MASVELRCRTITREIKPISQHFITADKFSMSKLQRAINQKNLRVITHQVIYILIILYQLFKFEVPS